MRIEIGTKVQGKYFGIAYSGTVSATRLLTVAPYDRQYTVALDTPIAVAGRIAETLLTGNGEYYGTDRSIQATR